MPPSLMDMPDVVMDRILRDVDFVEIQILRKVCHDLRNYIDDKVPEGNCLGISISISPAEIRLRIKKSIEDLIAPEIRYSENGDSTILNFSDFSKSKFLGNLNFQESFLQDFDSILRHQKGILPSFSFRIHENQNSEILEKISKILEPRILKVEGVEFHVSDETPILKIFSNFDSKFLKTMGVYSQEPRLRYWNRQESENLSLLKIDKTSKLEQWRALKQVWFSRRIDEISLENFGHFSAGFVQFKSIDSDGMKFLKKSFQANPNFHNFCVDYSEFKDIENFLSFLGPAYEFYGEKKWFFKVADVEKCLSIFCDPMNKQFTFGQIDRKHVPPFDVDIQDS